MSVAPKYDFFIVHASADKAIAERLYTLLKDADVSVFLDKHSLAPGVNWPREIQLAQKNSLISIVLLSSNVDVAYFAQEEIIIALELAKENPRQHRVVPVFINSCLETLPNGIPYGLRQKQGISLENADDLSNLVNKLLNVLRNPDQQAQDKANHVLQGYRQQRITHWQQKQYELDKRFIKLVLLLDQGLESEGLRFQDSHHKFDDLLDLVQQIPNKAFVLLGRPGCGKSTLLRYLEYQLCSADMEKPESQTPWPFYVELNRFSIDGEPLAWLEQQWQVRYPKLAAFSTLLQAEQPVWFLLDAINEMAYADFADYCDKIEAWRNFLSEFTQQYPLARFIFSCRSLDYSASLSDPEHFEVPHIRFEALSTEATQAFLQKRLAEDWQTLWAQLEQIEAQQTAQASALVTTPFHLDLQVKQYLARGRQAAKGPAELIAGMLWLALERELSKAPLKHNTDWLSQEDRRRLVNRVWIKAPHRLPKQGQLIPALITLALQMQTQHGAGKQIRVPLDKVLKWFPKLDETQARALLDMAWCLDVIDLDLEQETCAFQHQLLQEYCAAQGLVQQNALTCLNKPWQQGVVVPSLEQRLQELGKGDPLQGLPATGWEETCIHAAAISPEPESWIEQVLQQDLVLAARCVESKEVSVSEPLKTELSQRLLACSQDQAADIRARFDAGLALGGLEDPRFVKEQGLEAAFISPPLVEVPAGEYTIGSQIGRDNEKPVFKINLPQFKIGQFPVTNREFACFIEAGAYEDERWWDEDTGALAWQRGEREDIGNINHYRQLYQDLREDFEGTCARYPNWTEVSIEWCKDFAQWSLEALEDWLQERFGKQKHRLPLFWNDEAFNNPAQPVVGVSWFEAKAYGQWLSVQSGEDFVLPSEIYWEAAARGLSAREFPSGADLQGNVYESHWRQTTPIGIYPGTPEEPSIFDLAGNCWEWTASAYLGYPLKLTQSQELDNQNTKVLRGGSFYSQASFARASYRYYDDPGGRDGFVGFRLLLLPPS